MIRQEVGVTISMLESIIRRAGQIANDAAETGMADGDETATQFLWDVTEFAFNFSVKWGEVMAAIAEEKGRYSAAERFHSDDARYMRSLAERYDPEGDHSG